MQRKMRAEHNNIERQRQHLRTVGSFEEIEASIEGLTELRLRDVLSNVEKMRAEQQHRETASTLEND